MTDDEHIMLGIILMLQIPQTVWILAIIFTEETMSRRVGGSGPVPCSIMLIGQRPGIEEVRRGRPFIGKAGMELDRYLSVNAGISRDSVYVTNLVKTFDGVDEIEPEEIRRDWPELQDEMRVVAPVYIGLVGLYAARWFLGDDVEMEWSHGLQFDIPSIHKWMPLYHPAAGLHQSGIAAKIAWDFEQFGKMIRGGAKPAVTDAFTSAAYKETDCGVLLGTVAVDTEGTAKDPWCLSFSVQPGKAYVMRSADVIINSAMENLEEGEALVVMHNSIHDLPVLETMGVHPGKWTDTMLMAALLGLEPQSLKALARRHCGMVMQDYEDFIAEAKRQKALEHISKVIDWYAETNTTAAD